MGIDIALIERAVAVVFAVSVGQAATGEFLHVLALAVLANVQGAAIAVLTVGRRTTLRRRMLALMLHAQVFGAGVSIIEWLDATVQVAEAAPGDRRMRAAHAGNTDVGRARVGVVAPRLRLAIRPTRHKRALVVQAHRNDERVGTLALHRCPAAGNAVDLR